MFSNMNIPHCNGTASLTRCYPAYNFANNLNYGNMKEQKLKATLALVLFLFSAMGIFAQTRTITGTVYDEENTRFAGVTVTVSGTSVRTSTDAKGDFSIAAADNSSLTFTAIGYDAQTVPVGSRSQIS